MEGILGLLAAWARRGTPLAFVVFDVLQVDGRDVMAERWSDRRKPFGFGCAPPQSIPPPLRCCGASASTRPVRCA